MRGKKAKAVRKAVYGDKSPRARRYGRDSKTGAIFCMGLRADYQDKKRGR